MPKKNDNQLQAENRLLNNLETLKGTKKKIPTATPEEAEARKSAMRTQGKKGAKLTRINAAFTPENIEYIKAMGKIRGESMSEFINHVLDKHREENKEFFDQVKNIIDNT